MERLHKIATFIASYSWETRQIKNYENQNFYIKLN